jgi:hypothetical protein
MSTLIICLIGLDVVAIAAICWHHLHPRPAKTRLVLSTVFINNLKFEGIIMSSKLNIKQFVQGVISLVNHADNSPIAASFANETFVSADPAIAAVVVDPTDGPDTAILDIQGVAVGETDITITADATYKDPNTGEVVTKSKSVTVHVTISEPVSEAETDLVVTLGDPQPVAETPAA